MTTPPNPSAFIEGRLEDDRKGRRVAVNAAEVWVFDGVRRGTCPSGTHIVTIELS
jgi:hypothetical protein